VGTNFGLVDRQYTNDSVISQKGNQWQRFQEHIEHLNGIDATREFKVLFLGRHGEGVHNVAESHYGTKLWDVGRRYHLSSRPKSN
jgi:hypothetical protein